MGSLLCRVRWVLKSVEGIYDEQGSPLTERLGCSLVSRTAIVHRNAMLQCAQLKTPQEHSFLHSSAPAAPHALNGSAQISQCQILPSSSNSLNSWT